MKKAEIIIDKYFLTGKVDKRIFGSFIEHLGRAVYEGIYQEGSALSDEQGLKRYPGSCQRASGTDRPLPGRKLCLRFSLGRQRRPERQTACKTRSCLGRD